VHRGFEKRRSGREPDTLEALTAVSKAAAAAAAEHVSSLAASLAHREQHLRLARSGAARQLVQIGLFDGRATREAERRQDLDQRLDEESEQQLRLAGATPILCIDTRLVAVLRVGRER
jgi:hypothetical protein